MKINAGDKLIVKHQRKGTFKAVALCGFDTEKDEWYSMALAEGEMVKAMSDIIGEWIGGEHIPCRASLCTVSLV